MDKIDANNDSYVDLSELKKWIQFTQRRYIDEDVDRQWRQHNKNDEDFVQWEVSYILWYSLDLKRLRERFRSQ